MAINTTQKSFSVTTILFSEPRAVSVTWEEASWGLWVSESEDILQVWKEELIVAPDLILILSAVCRVATSQVMQLGPGQCGKPGRRGQGLTLWLCQPTLYSSFVSFLWRSRCACLIGQMPESPMVWRRQHPGLFCFLGDSLTSHEYNICQSLPESQPHQCSCDNGFQIQREQQLTANY